MIVLLLYWNPASPLQISWFKYFNQDNNFSLEQKQICLFTPPQTLCWFNNPYQSLPQISKVYLSYIYQSCPERLLLPEKGDETSIRDCLIDRYSKFKMGSKWFFGLNITRLPGKWNSRDVWWDGDVWMQPEGAIVTQRFFLEDIQDGVAYPTWATTRSSQLVW